ANSSRRILLAMSGGVDSSTAGALLLEAGYEVIGVHMRMPSYGDEPGGERRCCGEKGVRDARRVARELGIPFYSLSYRKKFEESVLKNFREEYRHGRTPNPCVRCNQWLKFGMLRRTATALEADHIATGHYVRKRFDDTSDRWELLRGTSEDDQSYFLFSLRQDQLAMARFPLGALTKKEVREKARTLDLPVHDTPGSTDLCFLPSGDYRDVLREQAPELFRTGPVLHVSGERIGQHQGVAAYTIGQRRGLGIAWDAPLYVVELRPEDNVVVVGEKQHIFHRTCRVGELNWISVPPPTGERRATVKIRFMHPGAPATILPAGDRTVKIQFDEPQMAPTPGQAAVFYDGERVLGGGFIRRHESNSRNDDRKDTQ
ncbi:MAG: tRNA 2-thiouridine(34) synthase MnmA, partial [Candidatus Brocadiia bacterium]